MAKDSGEAVTMRLPEGLLNDLRMVARIDEVSTAEAFRRAVLAWVALRQGDAEFQARLRERVARDRRMLHRLAIGAIVEERDRG